MKISLLRLLHRWQLLNKQNIEIMKSPVGSDAGRGFFHGGSRYANRI